MLPHRIHLRGPWELTLAGQPPRTIHLGRNDFPEAPRGIVEWRRKFGQPRRLDAHERVWLCLEGTRCSSGVFVNGESLGSVLPGERWERDISDRIAPMNQVRIDQQDGPLGWDDVFLEIRAIAFLEQVNLVRLGTVRDDYEIHGTIRGQAGLSLDIYVLAERTCLAHQRINVTADTTTFRLSVPALSPLADASAPQCRVELVAESVPWHVVHLSPPLPLEARER